MNVVRMYSALDSLSITHLPVMFPCVVFYLVSVIVPSNKYFPCTAILDFKGSNSSWFLKGIHNKAY